MSFNFVRPNTSQCTKEKIAEALFKELGKGCRVCLAREYESQGVFFFLIRYMRKETNNKA